MQKERWAGALGRQYRTQLTRRADSTNRPDSGFASEELMAWCEANRVGYVFGLARNPRPEAALAAELAAAKCQHLGMRVCATMCVSGTLCWAPQQSPRPIRLWQIGHSRPKSRLRRQAAG
jgi:hypothetical protein